MFYVSNIPSPVQCMNANENNRIANSYIVILLIRKKNRHRESNPKPSKRPFYRPTLIDYSIQLCETKANQNSLKVSI